MKAIKSNQGKCALREKKNIFYLSFSIVWGDSIFRAMVSRWSYIFAGLWTKRIQLIFNKFIIYLNE
jgi:hypothetical protein